MIASVLTRFSGSSLTARFARSSVFAMSGYVASQGLRLAANLILTRLLFPEAFGLMGLVTVFLQGLAMFSDVGVGQAIMQSKRGDDQDFLNTAWTIQVIRGALLWVFAAAIAWPIAEIYGEPILAIILPVAGLGLFISGFNPTRMNTANRHLLLGRITSLELLGQFAGIVVAVVLSWLMQSVWALVISGIATSAFTLMFYTLFLPGAHNRFRWEKTAAQELIHFGKWIFLSTICGFLFLQGDKLIIGKYLPIDQFGIFNIGFFLASVPFFMGGVLTQKVLIPLYRERPPAASRDNFRKLQKMRFILSLGMLLMAGSMSAVGVILIELLYDPRYHAAGAVVVVIAAVQMPQTIVLTYEQAALAAGNSKGFFTLSAARAVFTVGFVIVGMQLGGLFGALVGLGLAGVAAYPFVVWLARKSGAWDVTHDVVFFALGLIIAALCFWINADAISGLMRL